MNKIQLLLVTIPYFPMSADLVFVNKLMSEFIRKLTLSISILQQAWELA